MQTGGMAAVAVTFARYFRQIVDTGIPDGLMACLVLLVLSLINCLGVQYGSNVQNTLMVLKIGAVAVLIVVGFRAPHAAVNIHNVEPPFAIGTFGAAMVPVLFAYGGWQTASFMTGEMRNPKRDLARALLFGVIAVTVVYLSVNVVCLRVLGIGGLADTTTPAFSVMERAIGPRGAMFMAVAIAVSTLGFLSQGMLTAPRVFFAMAKDGLFFRILAWLEEDARAGGGDPAAGRACFDRSVIGQVRTDLELCGVGGLHLLRADRRVAFCVSQAHDSGAGTSNTRASVYHHLLHRRLLAGGAGNLLPLPRE